MLSRTVALATGMLMLGLVTAAALPFAGPGRARKTHRLAAIAFMP
jgi:hypothetical protein